MLMACVQGKVNWPNAKWSGGTMAELGQIFATNWVAAIQRGLRKNGENTSVMLPRGGKRTAPQDTASLATPLDPVAILSFCISDIGTLAVATRSSTTRSCRSPGSNR